VLEIAEAAEAEMAKRRTCRGPHKRKAEEINKNEIEGVLGNSSSESDHDCIVVAMRR